MKLEKRIQIIIRYWFPPIGFAGIIFLFSLQPYLKSSFPSLVDLILRKIAHMTEYFILTLLLARVGLRDTKECLKQFIAVLVAGFGALMTAVLDENIQKFVPGREGCFQDVGIDSVGIAIAIFVIIWYITKSGSFKIWRAR